jgi:ElaB/YqjD/DUF883 family membrane-anchored ribosome-binding protein
MEEPMNIQQDPGKSGSTQATSGTEGSGTLFEDVGRTTREAATRLSGAAQQMGTQAKEAATSLASEANENIKDLLNQKVAVGADLVGHVAQSARAAADNLKQNAPQLAGLVRGAADKMDEFSATARNQSIDDLFQTASDFARRQPAVVFGAAAAAGFLLFRTLKVAPSNRAGRNGSAREGLEGRYREAQGDHETGRNRTMGGYATQSGLPADQRHGA